MITEVNPETGETIEISTEEFMEILQNGSIQSIQQEVAGAEGTISSISIFGNGVGDDHNSTVNIFINEESCNAFAIRNLRKLTGEIESRESEKDSGELFEMIIDFTDSATMSVIKRTQNELSLNVYLRDERRATYADYLKESKTWKVSEGSIVFNSEELHGESKTVSLYMLAFLEIRHFLKETGMLDNLKKLGNRGTGVVIKATGLGDNPKAHIVRGFERPDLPCYFLGFGESMLWRPYIDELL